MCSLCKPGYGASFMSIHYFHVTSRYLHCAQSQAIQVSKHTHPDIDSPIVIVIAVPSIMILRLLVTRD